VSCDILSELSTKVNEVEKELSLNNSKAVSLIELMVVRDKNLERSLIYRLRKWYLVSDRDIAAEFHRNYSGRLFNFVTLKGELVPPFLARSCFRANPHPLSMKFFNDGEICSPCSSAENGFPIGNKTADHTLQESTQLNIEEVQRKLERLEEEAASLRFAEHAPP